MEAENTLSQGGRFHDAQANTYYHSQIHEQYICLGVEQSTECSRAQKSSGLTAWGHFRCELTPKFIPVFIRCRKPLLLWSEKITVRCMKMENQATLTIFRSDNETSHFRNSRVKKVCEYGISRVVNVLAKHT
jgi:hypothetical protein